MDKLDPGAESLRMAEHYRDMADGELLALAQQKNELTPIAQQALANEMATRKLEVPQEEPVRRPVFIAPDPKHPTAYDEDRRPTCIATVWSLRDALQLQSLLDAAGIPFSMGREEAPDVDSVTSNFDDGVDVDIMSVGLPWAREALKNFFPKDDRTPAEEKICEEIPVLCPACHSAEVTFDELIPDLEFSGINTSRTRFKWTCESCGHHWQDTGIVNPATSQSDLP